MMRQSDAEALERAVRAECGNTAGLVVQRGGETVFERYFNGCGPDTALHVFSVTKSVISALVGIAIDEGYIKSADQRVLDFFEDYLPRRGERTARLVTLRDLLTMRAPYKFRSEPYTRYFTSESWVRTALDLLGGRSPIGGFRYTPLVGPDILSGVISRATGRSARRYAAEKLFGPLGISAERDIVFHSKEEQLAVMKSRGGRGWVADPQGVNAAGWGLFLTAREMAKIGQLYLSGGVWNGARLIGEDWIAQSAAVQNRWEERGLSYGLMWWVADEREGSFAALGDGGNAIYVNPSKEAVVTMLSLFRPRVADRVAFIRGRVEPLL